MGVPAWSSRSAQSARQALGVKLGALLLSFIAQKSIITSPPPATDLHPLFMLPAAVSGNRCQEQIPGISIQAGKSIFAPFI